MLSLPLEEAALQSTGRSCDEICVSCEEEMWFVSLKIDKVESVLSCILSMAWSMGVLNERGEMSLDEFEQSRHSSIAVAWGCCWSRGRCCVCAGAAFAGRNRGS